ncbi:proton channel OTOP2-like [Ambystoma mexicanum]|uniref:proton channel OTOP2-like n=1 Tax=Ambystoma mexicanum TaxID=8296 RepID=UPI0037E7E82A
MEPDPGTQHALGIPATTPEERAEAPPTPAIPSGFQKKGGRLLSLLLAINLLLIGCAMVTSGGLDYVVIHDLEVLIMLTILMCMATVCMLIMLFSISRNQDAVLYKDSHAGPIWLRGGMVFFGTFILMQDTFKMGYLVILRGCESPLKIIHPVVQTIFVIVQTYFLFVSCKKCVQIHTNLTRHGLMLVLVTNLIMWMAAVTDESNHHYEEERQHQVPNHRTENTSMDHDHTSDDDSRSWMIKGAIDSTESCQCNSSLCHVFENGYYYMYPFNIEYNLFAVTLTYIMWRNVGRLIDGNVQHKRPWKLCFCMPTFFLGIILGTVVLLLGLMTLIFYKVDTDSEKALVMLYIFSICALSVMSLASLIGSIIYRFDRRDMVSHKNPSRTLDMTLLLGAALGQYCISYYSIVAIVTSSPGEYLAVLNLLYSILVIVQHSFQNIFIIEGLHRQSYKDTEHHDSENLPGLFYANSPVVSNGQNEDGPSLASSAAQTQHVTATSTPGMLVTAESASMPSKRPQWKRKFLREILLFLLLCNVIFWIIPAFGARPQLKYNLEQEFYGSYMWDIVVNVSFPFGIFYRLHSVASLLEVFMST